MKKLIAFIAALCMALPAVAAPKKEEKGKDKDKKMEKEVPAQMWSVTVEGATGETAVEEVKAFLSAMKGVKVETIEKKDNNVEAVISSKEKVSRSDVSKALKEKKELKVKEFKTKRPDKAGDKKDAEKAGEGTKGDPKKPETTKPDAPKPATTKPDAPKPEATKPATTKPEEPKNEEK